MPRRIHLRTFLALAASSLVLAGCDPILGSLSGAYDGPLPARDDLRSELVVVYEVRTNETEIASFIADRIRFAEAGRPHDVNRVVRVYSRDVRDQVAALEVQVGDTLRVSTRFLGIGEIGGLNSVPNWPGHKADEYPIGEHLLTAAEKP